MKRLIQALRLWIRKFKAVCRAQRRSKEIAGLPSYYPERQRKILEERIKDNNLWAQNYCEVNEFYTLYGLDTVGSDASGFIDLKTFMKTRNNANHVDKREGSQIVLLRDKFLFFKYMKSNNMPVPEIFALIKDGMFYDSSFNSIDVESLKNETDYFIKEIDGECASFVHHIKKYDELLSIKGKISTGSYILQRKIKQVQLMSELNPCAVNTLRIITINKNGNPFVLSALLRVGTNVSGNVDNWAAGGIAVGIEPNGELKEWGFYKPIYGIKTNVHPNTGIKFVDFKVPMYKEALELACKAHKTFYDLRAIGWDVAITETGPVFVEGNDNFEISLQQSCDRPLRQEWLEAME